MSTLQRSALRKVALHVSGLQTPAILARIPRTAPPGTPIRYPRWDTIHIFFSRAVGQVAIAAVVRFPPVTLGMGFRKSMQPLSYAWPAFFNGTNVAAGFNVATPVSCSSS